MKQNLLAIFISASLFLNSGYSATAQTIAAGGNHSIFVCANGDAKATGANTFGQLGNGTTNPTSTPVAVSGLTGVVAAASRDQFTLYLLSDSTVWAVGYNGFGQLGNGTTTNSDTAIQIPNLTGVIKIAAGFYHSLFLKSDSTVWACGRNFSGELGDGTQVLRNTPVQVTSLSGVVDIAAGDNHSMFLLSDSTVWSCGDNQNGCLGLGTSSPLQVVNPTQVISMSGVKLIAGGFRHSLFVKHDGTAWACGFNNEGQLGDGTTIQKDTAIQVNNLSNIVGIAAGQYHSLFLKDDGTAWGVGYNAFGQLGNGNNISQTTPVQVNGLTGVTKVTASGYFHSLFLKDDNTFWGCGQNSLGELGDGTSNTSTIPVQALDGCVSTAVSEIDKSMQTRIYPNPSNGLFNIQVNGSLSDIYTIEIYNHSGELVYGGRTLHSNNVIDLSNKSKGLYFYKIISTKDVVSVGKMVVN